MSCLAIDIGASSGRHILFRSEGGRLNMQEIYRFPNGMTEKNGHLCWDYDAIFAHILEGMRRCKALGEIPSEISQKKQTNWFHKRNSNSTMVIMTKRLTF